jgi:NhaP-type Na+/H+ and K+/H+ antiporter
VLAAYDGALDSPHGGTLGDMLSASLPRAVVGDQVRVGRLRFTVREMREDKITQVGLKLD